MTAPPIKTELGQQELRRRKRTLGQRHRTMLLLVDGKRSRDEVLSLAQQVGVGPGHFDELIGWGMVVGEPVARPPAEAAIDAPPAPADEAPALVTSADAADEPSPAPDAAAAPAPDDVGQPSPVPQEPGPAADASTPPDEAPPVLEAIAPTALTALTAPAPPIPDPVEPPEDPAPDRIYLAPMPAPAPASAARPLPARRVAPSRRSPRIGAPPLPRDPEPFLPLESPRAAVPVLSEPVGEIPAHVRPIVLDPALDMALPDDDGDSEEGRLLGEVRSLLIGTLLVDAPVSSSLTALRVHRARDRESLVRLVWEVERSLVRARRPREAQARLTRARDLLGLGNTVVHEQTLPGYPGGD